MQSWAEAVRNSSDESSSSSKFKLDDSDKPMSHVASHHLSVLPPQKHQCWEILNQTERIAKRVKRQRKIADALKDLWKLMKSKKTHYMAGPDGLQVCQTGAMKTHLRLVIENRWSLINASEQAAKSYGFAAKWGGRQVCKWTHHYIQMQDLPKSLVKNHAKVYSLLLDPDIAARLRAYVYSNKWAMDPEKLAKFL